MKAVPKNNVMACVFAIISAFISILSITSFRWEMAFRASGHFYLLLWIGMSVWYCKVIPTLSGRRRMFSLIGGGIFASCQAVGQVLHMGGSFGDMMLLWPGYVLLYTAAVATLLWLLDKWQSGLFLVPINPGKRLSRFDEIFLSGSRKSTLYLWGLLVLCHLPYFILFWPGITSVDTAFQMGMGLGVWQINSHQPPLYTYMWAACMQIGKALFGNFAQGVAIATFLQVVFMAGVFALSVSYMKKISIAKPFQVAALVFYALCPAVAWYSVTLWKDVPLAGFSLLFLLCVYEIVKTKSAFFKSFKQISVMVLASAGMILSKNNGIYVFVIACIFLLLSQKGIRLQLSAVLLLGVILHGIIQGPVYTALDIKKGSVGEALSVPMLQVALVVKTAPDTISAEDQALIDSVLPYDELGNLYDPMVSDSIKQYFDDSTFAEDQLIYGDLWLRLGLQHPNLYVRAFLEHTYAYYYTDATQGVFSLTPYTAYIREFEVDFEGLEEMAGQYSEPMRPVLEIVEQKIGTEHNIPGFSMLFTAGFYFWVLLFCCLWSVYQKRYQNLVIMGLPFGIWLTCLLSPVNGSFRYAYPAIVCVPVLLGICLGIVERQKEK